MRTFGKKSVFYGADSSVCSAAPPKGSFLLKTAHLSATMTLMISRRRSASWFSSCAKPSFSQFALPVRVSQPWEHASSGGAVSGLRPSSPFQCDRCACQTGGGTTRLLKVAFGNASEKILSCVWAAPSASHTLSHCCTTNRQCSAGSAGGSSSSRRATRRRTKSFRAQSLPS